MVRIHLMGTTSQMALAEQPQPITGWITVLHDSAGLRVFTGSDGKVTQVEQIPIHRR